jgi:hypothetical protein
MELEAWLPWVVSVASIKETRRGAEAAPGSAGERDGARGEETGRGMQGRFSGRSSNLRTPAARQRVGVQGDVDNGQQEEDKGSLVR